MEMVLLSKLACGSNLLGKVPAGGSKGYGGIHYIAGSRANRSVAIVPCRESAFRGTIGGPIDSTVYIR